MSYSRFTVEDFVLDKKFRQWVLSPDAESNLFWQSWLERHREKKAVLQEARAIILKMPHINYGWNSELEDSLWQSIVQDTQKDPVKSSTKVIPLHTAAVLGSLTNKLHRRQWNYQIVGRLAATILLIFIIGIAGYLGYHGHDDEVQPVAYFTKEAPWGTKVTFHLPDGTKVMLNSGSEVRYPERFTGDERLLTVKGEVYFEVAKDSLRPFRVKTGAVMTEALGTAFNVIYEKNRVEIALMEGKVQVSLTSAKAQEKLILAPGEQASVQDEAYLVKDAFDVENVIAWTKSIISFKGAGEQEVINTLERWYGVNISIEGQSPKAWNFLGRFKNKSLEHVLQSIGYTMDFHFTIEGDEVKIVYP